MTDETNKPDPFAEKFAGGETEAAPEGTSDAAEQLPPDAPLKDRIVEKLKTVYDPEIPVNLYDLGLIYDLDVDEASGVVKVTMTLTTPMCPVAESMPGEVESKVRDVPGVSNASVELVWDPPWDLSKLSEAAMLELGMI